jgi:hypothetical protein
VPARPEAAAKADKSEDLKTGEDDQSKKVGAKRGKNRTWRAKRVFRFQPEGVLGRMPNGLRKVGFHESVLQACGNVPGLRACLARAFSPEGSAKA